MHDFGAFDADGHRIFFKIDYYDESLTYHSPDPADPSVTKEEGAALAIPIMRRTVWWSGDKGA